MSSEHTQKFSSLTLARQIFLSLAYPPKGASREECFILQSFMLENADFIGLKWTLECSLIIMDMIGRCHIWNVKCLKYKNQIKEGQNRHFWRSLMGTRQTAPAVNSYDLACKFQFTAGASTNWIFRLVLD